MSILCDHIVLFVVLEVLSQEREVGSRLGAGSKGTPETLACLHENSYGRPFISKSQSVFCCQEVHPPKRKASTGEP